MATIVQVPASAMNRGTKFSFKITVDPQAYRDLRQITAGLQMADRLPFTDNTILSSGIANIGQQWAYNYFSGGGQVGGWKANSPYTLAEKERRGYHNTKILEQSGAFYNGGIAGIGLWRTGQTSYSALIPATPYHSSDPDFSIDSGPTGVGASLMNGRFTATMNGPKAQNQMGGAIRFGSGFDRQYVNLPARPFWFFTQNMIDNSSRIIANQFLASWVQHMPRPVGAANRAVIGTLPSGVIQTHGRTF